MAVERLSVFPAFHKVSRRPVLVVGSGVEAVAKVRLLLETEAEIRLVGQNPERELLELAASHPIEHRLRPFDEHDLDGAVLAFAASGNREADAKVVSEARARNIPANAVDSPDLCDFYTPAIVNRAPVAVAISSTGAGPVLAQKLRARIEALLPLELGALAHLGNTFRTAAERMLPKGQPRRRFWSAFFEGRIADAALAGQVSEARRLASRLLTEADAEARGFIWLVGAGPGEPDLLTLRAQRVLQEADVIVHDPLVAGAVITMGRRDARRIRLASNPTNLTDLLIHEGSAGRRVVYLHPGDGLQLSPGQLSALRASSILFDAIPGVKTDESVSASGSKAA